MVNKFFSAVLVALAVFLFEGIAATAPAHAASTSTSVYVVKSAPTFVDEKVAMATVAAPNVIGDGVIKPFWRYVSCYAAMDGYVWCWRYACTTTEYWLQGCRDGWYRIPKLWYV